MEGVARLLEASGRLLGALAWPLLVLGVALLFRAEIRSFFASLEAATVKVGGAEVTLTRAREQVAAAIAAADASGAANARAAPGHETLRASAAHAPVQSALGVVAGVTSRTLRRLGQLSLLWVDDVPENTVFERQALEALGISIVTALTTEEALSRLQGRDFALVISDMARPPDQLAGYTLLDRLRAAGDPTPLIIYSSTETPEQRAEAERKGAAGQTSTAAALVQMVLRQMPGP